MQRRSGSFWKEKCNVLKYLMGVKGTLTIGSYVSYVAIWKGTGDIPVALGPMTDTLERARDEIVFALRRPIFEREPREARPEPKEKPRLPVKVQQCDLDAAIDDMIEHFPTTLDYLAK
jgi:hypothetical protein